MGIFDETQEAYTHNGDRDLLKSLGLKTEGFGRDWTDIGTVVVEEADPENEYGPRPAATVKVEVSAMPAMFWRLTVTRPVDDSDGWGPTESFVVNTGSGGFVEYWPTAKALAENMISIEPVEVPA